MKRYFAMDTFNSDYEEFETEEEALKYAEECIGDGSDGWAQELLDGAVKVGVITHESSKVNERHTENEDWDFECECEMVEVEQGTATNPETFNRAQLEAAIKATGLFICDKPTDAHIKDLASWQNALSAGIKAAEALNG